MGAGIAAAAALSFWLERGLTYGFDEYIWIQTAALGGSEDLWHPYGGHLIVFPYYVFRAVLDLFGNSFLAFGIIQIAGLSAMAALLYIYVRRRLGPILALGPAFVLLLLGGSYPVLYQPLIGIQFLCALLPGLAAIIVLEREDLRGDIAACALLLLSVAGFSDGLIFLAGAVVAVALSPARWHRIWVVAVPIVAYAYWRHWASKFGEPSGIVASNIPWLPSYFADALAVYATSIFGLVGLVGPGPWSDLRLAGGITFGKVGLGHVTEGVVILTFELIGIGAAVFALRRRLGGIPRSLWPAVAMMLVYFSELGVVLIPGRTANEARYLYAGVLLLMMVGAELARGVRTTRISVVVVGLLTVAAVVGNLPRTHDSRAYLDDYAKRMRSDMEVIDLAGRHVDPAFTPNLDVPGVAPDAEVLNAGPWEEAVARYGSPAYSIPVLRKQAETVRAEADQVSARALQLTLTPTRAKGDCERIPAATTAAGFALPAGGATLIPAAPTSVDLRRWADEFSVSLGQIDSGRATALRIPPDASRVPWEAKLEPAGTVELCSRRGNQGT